MSFIKEFADDFFLKLVAADVHLLQVYCRISSQEAKRRIHKRLDDKQRHHCHQDHLRIDLIIEAIDKGVYDKLSI